MRYFPKTAACLFIVFPVVLFSFCTKSSSPDNSINPPPVTPPTVDTSVYQLAWSDEFNGTAVDAGVWNFETGGNGWGNNEQEYYLPDNATVEDGNLVITAKKKRLAPMVIRRRA